MDTAKDKQTATVLVTDGTNYFALCHVQDTPVTLWDPGTDWDKLAGTLSWGGRQVPLQSMSFDAQDPRVVMMPVTRADAHKLGCKVYRLSSDPYKFQDAVLVGANEEYYGQCNFQIEMNTPQYVKLDRSLLKGLFGKFNPSRGDLVFSRTGELLGIMVNNTYCLTIRAFAPPRRLRSARICATSTRAERCPNSTATFSNCRCGCSNRLLRRDWVVSNGLVPGLVAGIISAAKKFA